MTTFSDPNFSHSNYATARPSYPQRLYDMILNYHNGNRNHCLDLGTGHGLVARALSAQFKHITATDPSKGMLKTARDMTPKADYPNINYLPGSSEQVPPFEVLEQSVDVVTAAQAAHWFDYERTWPELFRVLRPGGTLALWGYSDIVFPTSSAATRVLQKYSYGEDKLRPFWTMPGRGTVENRYADVVPGKEWFENERRVEYVPGTGGEASRWGECLMKERWTVGQIMGYVRTWSAVHKWKEANPESEREGDGDIIDWLFDEIAGEDEVFKDLENEVSVEWGTGIVLARRRAEKGSAA